MDNNIKEIFLKFNISADFSPYGNGYINDTYITNSKPKYILQRINTNVFTNPEKLMENIKNVTEHLKAKILQNGGDISRETLSVINTTDGKPFYQDRYGNCYRVYNFIDNTFSIDRVTNPQELYEAGKAFGQFQKLLAEFPAESLYDVIPDFHNTPKRIETLKKAIKNDSFNRVCECKAEINFALQNEKSATAIQNAVDLGEIPKRVTHNDTKINNLLFDKATMTGLCVIDLDTVMCGSLLYDFGDALRSGATTARDDEKNLDLIEFNLDYFKEFSRGFLEESVHSITDSEFNLLAVSAKILSYECGIRFLTDYLCGDTYFKTQHKKQNLERARTQFKLAHDIDSKLPEMNRILDGLRKTLK